MSSLHPVFVNIPLLNPLLTPSLRNATPEVRVGYELSASLRQQGITESTDIEVFWELFSQRMSSEEDKTACRAIGAELKSKFFALFVESMYDLSRSEILEAIESCGGQPA